MTPAKVESSTFQNNSCKDVTPSHSHGELLTRSIRNKALELGFDICRIIPIIEAPNADFFDAWIDAGRAGEMNYLTRHRDKRRHPHLLAEEEPIYRSMIVLAVNYHRFDLPIHYRDDPSRGIIASYAWGDDYHELIRPLLYNLDEHIRTFSGRQAHGKCLVDTGPVLERDWAQRSGAGFIGKNCCTIHPAAGSWLFLATVMVPEVLEYDAVIDIDQIESIDHEAVLRGVPPAGDYGRWQIPLFSTDQSLSAVTPAEPTATGTCGQCTRCMDACPTDAFVGPYHLDPLRCISYWTIESKQPVPRSLRSAFGNRIFGCDICQEVCPWNRRLLVRDPLLPGLRARADRIAPPLLAGFDPATPYWLDQQAFSEQFRKSPVKRAKRHGMLRNVCIALGNWGHSAAVPALQQALRDPHPLPRGHAAWALGQIAAHMPSAETCATVRASLAAAREIEREGWVCEEIALALTA